MVYDNEFRAQMIKSIYFKTRGRVFEVYIFTFGMVYDNEFRAQMIKSIYFKTRGRVFDFRTLISVVLSRY